MAKRICGKRLPSGGVCTRPAGCTITHASAPATVTVTNVRAKAIEVDTPSKVLDDGTMIWMDADGAVHRDGDRPAIIRPNKQEWQRHGQYHRDGDLPAIIGADFRSWWQNGKLHRDGDLPAVEDDDGGKKWFRHGLLHRDGGKPAIIFADGTWAYFVDGVEQDRR